MAALARDEETISGNKPQRGDIVKIQRLIALSQPRFTAFNGCSAVRGFRLFNLPKEILEKSPEA